tara:strand:- start:82 stop:531 length:450 start_codon:yes stop_codon:yes gene_type:complete
MKLDLKGIHEYQQNRHPYLFIDYVDEVIPGKIANGFKDLKDDWFFKVHWPTDPNVPGMLQIEAMVQMAALTILTLPNNKGKVVYLASADKITFKRKIVPGDRLYLKTKLKSWNRGIGKCEGVGTVNDKLACKAEFTLVLPEKIKKYTVK